MARATTAAVRLTTGEREPCRLATTANIDTVEVDGLDVIQGLKTIDGVLTEVGDRVLVKDQTNKTINGIYTASTGTWRRAADARSARTMQKGTTVHIQQGSTNAGNVYSFQTYEPNIGADDIELALYMTDAAGQAILDAKDDAEAAAQSAADDAIATAADRAQTGLDAIATAADRIQTGLDAQATAADRVQTGLDAIATAADRVQTGLDRTAAENAKTAAENAAASINPALFVEIADTDASGFGFVIDEDDMASDSATKVPTQQSVKAYVDAAFVTLVRERLTANRTYYVRSDGNNNNDGLSNSSGGAFLTIQKALNVVLGTLDLGGFNVTIQVGSGTYSGVSFTTPQVGAGNITIVGDTTTPANVTVGAITVDGAGCRLIIAGLNVSKGSGQYCIKATNGGFIRTSVLNKFSSTSGGHRILAELGGTIEAIAAEIVQGTVAGSHYRTVTNGLIYCQGATWTADGTATQGSFAGSTTGGVIYAFSNSETGTFAGARYTANTNGIIQTNGGGASYFPGDSAGSTATGGQYA